MIVRITGRVCRRNATAIAIFAALTVVSLPAAAEAPRSQTAATTSVSIPDEGDIRGKNRNELIVRGHGFVRDSGGAFTMIDAPRATLFTIAFGIDESGKTVGAYADGRGRTRGFLQNQSGKFITIDFPGAAATFVSKINRRGHMVGAWDNDRDAPLFELPHGFLLENGVFTRIDFPGAVETRALGINNQGQIVGEYLDANTVLHGFLLANGVFTSLDPPGSVSTAATGIDDSGRITGYFSDTTGATHGFLRDAGGAFTPIDVPGAVLTEPFSINNSGEIAGFFVPANVDERRVRRGFVLQDGVFTTIESPEASPRALVFDIDDRGRLAGAYNNIVHGYVRDERGEFTAFDAPGVIVETAPFGINNRGEIVGGYDADRLGNFVGFKRDRRGRFTRFTVPGAAGTGANAINDRGQIVGDYSETSPDLQAAPSTLRGFLLEHGEFTSIDFPGAAATQAFDIDNHGQIVGLYRDGAGANHGYLRDTSGHFTTIDIPGAVFTELRRINDRGQMAGGYVDADGRAHGFIMENGAVTATIDAPGALATSVIDINNRGQLVVIAFFDALTLRRRAFLFSNGKFTPIVPPGTLTEGTAFGIDDRGRIVGTIG